MLTRFKIPFHRVGNHRMQLRQGVALGGNPPALGISHRATNPPVSEQGSTRNVISLIGVMCQPFRTKTSRVIDGIINPSTRGRIQRQRVTAGSSKQTFDCVLTKEEQDAIDLEKLDGSPITLAVDDIEPANGGRHKFKGKVDRTSVPKQVLRNNGAENISAKPQAAVHQRARHLVGVDGKCNSIARIPRRLTLKASLLQ